MILRKYDSAGNFQWMASDAGAGESRNGYGVAVDSNNNIDVVGGQSENGGDAVLWQYDGGGVGRAAVGWTAACGLLTAQPR